MYQPLDLNLFSIIDTDSSIGVGWKLYFYRTGTSTPVNSYPSRADAMAGTNPNANPIVINADGRLPPIWVTEVVKLVLTTATDVVAQTVDPANEPPLMTNAVNVADFGAISDGVTDNTAAFQDALDSFGGVGGWVHWAGKYYIAGNLTVPHNVTLVGPYAQADTPGGQPTHPSAGDYRSINHIALNPASSIALMDGAAFAGGCLINSNITYPQTSSINFAGTGITIIGEGASVMGSIILGFNKCIYSNGPSRPRITDVNLDGINGIEIASCFDIPYVQNCHAWPFVTVGTGTAESAYRSGKAFYFHSSVDWPRVDNCFAYGYKNGFYSDNSSDGSFTNCSVDGPNPPVPDSVGFTFLVGIRNKVIGGTNSWQELGISINIDNGVANSVLIQGMALFAPTTVDKGDGINIGSATAEAHPQIIGCNFYGHNTSINLGSSPSGAAIIGNYFDSATTPVAGNGVNLLQSNILGNTYHNCVGGVGERHAFYKSVPVINYGVFGTDGGIVQRATYQRGTPIAPAAVQNLDQLIAIVGAGFTGSVIADAGIARVVVDGTVTGTSIPTKWVWLVTPPGSTTAGETLSLNSNSLFPNGDNALALGSSSTRFANAYIVNPHFYPPASNTPTVNGELLFEATSNTSVTVKLRGTDGVVRSVALTLA